HRRSAALAHGHSVTVTISQLLPVANADATYTTAMSARSLHDAPPIYTATDSASVTVSYANVDPSVKVTKSADVSTISEGGVGNQTGKRTYTVTNTSAATTDPVTITSLFDDKVGDLLDAFKAANGGSPVLAPGQAVTFSISQLLPVANAGATCTNTVSVRPSFPTRRSSDLTDSASVTVSYANVDPSVKVTKSADVTTLSEGGV